MRDDENPSVTRTLVIGGTGFLGRHIAVAALSAGHTVTILHRGSAPDDVIPDGEHFHCDRDDEKALNDIARQPFDAIFDVNGYQPSVVIKAARAFHRTTGRYIFISSTSVYADFSGPVVDESTPLQVPAVTTALQSQKVTPSNYGALKVACELTLHRWLGDRLTVVRPGLIVGPYDPTPRLTYWLQRFQRGGEVVAPGDSSRSVQMIDAGDLATWLVRHWTDRYGRVFNATGPNYRLTMGELMSACATVTQSRARVHWIADEVLLSQGVTPWLGLPLWQPRIDERWTAFMAVDSSAAHAAGLSHRPVIESLRAINDWITTNPESVARASPLDEAAILHAAGESGSIESLSLRSDVVSASDLQFDVRLTRQLADRLDCVCGSSARSDSVGCLIAPIALSIPSMKQAVSEDRLGAVRNRLLLTRVECTYKRLPQMLDLVATRLSTSMVTSPNFALTVRCHQSVGPEDIAIVCSQFAHTVTQEVGSTTPSEASALLGEFEMCIDASAISQWACATGDDSAIHQDDDAARGIGLSRACVPGLLSFSRALVCVVQNGLDGVADRIKEAEAIFVRYILTSEPVVCRVWNDIDGRMRFAIIGSDGRVRVVGGARYT